MVAAMAYLGLVAGQLLHFGPLAGGLLSLPLLLPMMGSLRARSYTAAWGSMLVLFYVGGYLVEYRSGSAGALWLSALATLAFCASLLFVKWRAVETRSAPSARTAPSGDDASR